MALLCSDLDTTINIVSDDMSREPSGHVLWDQFHLLWLEGKVKILVESWSTALHALNLSFLTFKDIGGWRWQMPIVYEAIHEAVCSHQEIWSSVPFCW